MGPSVAKQKRSHQKPVARQALGRSKGVFLSVGVFSGFVNALALAGSFYMLQVYDRILPSESVPTLVALTGLLVGLYFVYGALDLIRVRLMGRISARFDQEVREPVYKALHTMPLHVQTSSQAMQPLRDLDQVRTFLSGLGPAAFFDLPWVPIYLAAVYFLHPVLGLLATGGAIILVVITALTEIKSAKPTRDAAESGSERASLGEATRRNAEVIQAMGLAQHLRARWGAVSDRYVADQLAASDAVTGFGTVTKVLRLLLQSGVLGMGAYLVILDQVTPGCNYCRFDYYFARACADRILDRALAWVCCCAPKLSSIERRVYPLVWWRRGTDGTACTAAGAVSARVVDCATRGISASSAQCEF